MKYSVRSIIPVLVHVLLWALFGFILFFYHPLTWGFSVPIQFWIKQTLLLLLLAGTYYLNANFLVPQFLFKKRTYFFIALLLMMVIVTVAFVQLTENLLRVRELMSRVAFRPDRRPPPPNIDMFTLTMVCLVAGISTSVTSIRKWQLDSKIRSLLEQEKVSSELLFLKAQINPHFFFNTLNNIYALTHIDIDASRKSLLKLSRMMRYVLYETSQDFTSLRKEIAFIRDYIELMQLRFTEKVELHVDIPAPENDVTIAPMLFLPFIENAFKHGISVTSSAEIFVSLKQVKGGIIMRVSNQVFEKHSGAVNEDSGIGLFNTERRLNLLYPGKHMLKVNHDTGTNNFEVELKLYLP